MDDISNPEEGYLKPRRRLSQTPMLISQTPKENISNPEFDIPNPEKNISNPESVFATIVVAKTRWRLHG
jgi:hypothetical protein